MSAAWQPVASGIAAAFLASVVECVEALTVVLALGAARGWAAPLAGSIAALITLAALVAALGPVVAHYRLAWLQGVVGVLVLLFGLRWLRKAILRAAGLIPLRDEAAAFERAKAAGGGAPGWAWASCATAFQVVLMEGSEVVFIVVAVGAGGGGLGPAVIGAALALASVALLGLALRKPLTRVPENTLKGAVAVLLTAFGTVWTGEAMGVAWPSEAWGLPLISLVWAATALLLVRLARGAAA